MPNTLSRVSAPLLSDRSRNRHRAGTRNRCPSTAQYIPLPIHCQYGGMPLIPVIPANLGGPRLHGNDGRRRRTREAAGAPTIVIPATARGRRWVPVSTGTTDAPGIVIPATGARAAMGSRLHGNDGRTHIVIPATAGGPDGFPSPRERRWAAGPPIPATAGIHGGGPAGMGSRLHGNDGGTHIVIPATAGIHGGGAGDGFPSPRERRWAPTSSFPRQAGIHGGGPGDGFPSPRERRWGGSQVISE